LHAAVDHGRSDECASHEPRQGDGRAKRRLRIPLPEGQAEESGVAGHARREYLTQAYEAGSIDTTGGDGEQDQQDVARCGGLSRRTPASPL
jgi:hypothetical protein